LSQHSKPCAAVESWPGEPELRALARSQHSKPGAAVERGPAGPAVILRSFGRTRERLLSAAQNHPCRTEIFVSDHSAARTGHEQIRRVLRKFATLRALARGVASAHRDLLATQPLDHLHKLIACRELSV